MIITAIIMGFAGSLHCVGMCSPLAMAVNNLNPAAALNRLVYNLGRILTYGMLGAIIGTTGLVVPFAHFQNLLSIVLGVSLLLFAVLGLNSIRVPGLTPLFQKITLVLKLLFGKFLQRKSYASIFVLGSLNGVLPCGLTFLALAYCLTLGSPILSFCYMLLFGIGTLPVMLGLTSFAGVLGKRLNLSYRKIATTLLFISGCLLIARVFIFHAPHAAAEEHSLVDNILCR